MAENKKGFLLYADQLPLIEKLPDDKAGQVFKTILRYVNDLNPTVEDLVVDIVFEQFKAQLKRDLSKWEEKKEEKEQAGALGNLKRWAEDLHKKVVSGELLLEEAVIIAKNRKKSHSDSKQSHRVAEVAVSVNDNVNVSDSVIKKEEVVITPKTIQEREKEFEEKLAPFKEKYGEQMVSNFCRYWTEKNENAKKMRFEKESTFEISRRLVTWQENDKKFKKGVGAEKTKNRFTTNQTAVDAVVQMKIEEQKNKNQ